MYEMKEGPKGLSELERSIEGITQRRGRKMIEAIDILQMVGVDYMVENDMTDSLINKGILSEDEVSTIKNGSAEDIDVLIRKYFS